MPLTMSSASLPVMKHYLGVLSELLRRAEAHATSTGGDPLHLLDRRIFPDMHPLRAQVQFACDFAKGALARMGGKPVPAFLDQEVSFADLQERIAATLALLGETDLSAFDHAADSRVELRFAGQPMAFSGADYLIYFALPSLIFHVSIAYALMRGAGVPVGKADFLGDLPLLT